MRWNKDQWRWRRAFAFLPTQVSEDGKTVWLEWYEWRYRPDGYSGFPPSFEEVRAIGSAASFTYDTYHI